ncbi:restriction endonuclease [Janthinobacterium svalbardensis]|uniref:restriction endonuclease n=1 Tax=Janthinobacterium svalbardensis TaxID=368607 RepID=UPI002FCDD8F5
MQNFSDRNLPNILVAGDFSVGKTMLISRLSSQPLATGMQAISAINPKINFAQLSTESGQASLLELPPITTTLPRSVNISATLLLFDAMRSSTSRLISELDKINPDFSHPRILVVTKTDEADFRADVQALVERYSFDSIFRTSAINGSGIDALRKHILRLVAESQSEDERNVTKQAVISAVLNLSETLCALIANDASALQHIHWRQLEEVVAVALESVGFHIELTPSTKDGGKDVIATCRISNKEHMFYVEIKHWLAGGRPGTKQVSQFIEVNAKNGTSGGLFLSSSGYTQPVYGRLAEIAQQRVWLGDQEKIVSLCQSYVLSKANLWTPQVHLPTFLSERTLKKGAR